MISEALATITFNAIPDDYVAAYAIAVTRSSRDSRWWALFVLFVASWSATVVSLMMANVLSVQTAGVGAFCTLMFIGLFTVTWWPDPEKVARAHYTGAKNPRLFLSRTIQLEALGIRSSTENSETWNSWTIVRRVIITEGHVFITTNSINFFVPKLAFASEKEFLTFARIAQEHYTPDEDTTTARGFPVVMNVPTTKNSNS